MHIFLPFGPPPNPLPVRGGGIIILGFASYNNGFPPEIYMVNQTKLNFRRKSIIVTGICQKSPSSPEGMYKKGKKVKGVIQVNPVYAFHFFNFSIIPSSGLGEGW